MKTWAIVAVMFLTGFFWSCEDDPGMVGKGLLPEGDLIYVNAVLNENIAAYTFTQDTIRSDEASNLLLGSYLDPVFGRTTADFALQLRLRSYPSFVDSAGMIVDSIALLLHGGTYLGDSLSPQQVAVYELVTDLNIDDDYYSNIDFSALKGEKIGESTFHPKALLDTNTNVYTLKIKLDNTLAEKLVSADSLDLVDNDAFLAYFKGLVVETEEVTDSGSILSLARALNTGSSTISSTLSLYYRLNEEDTVSSAFNYYITDNSATASRYRHDYTSAPFYASLNQEENTDTLVYVQPLGGIRSKIIIPELEQWKDSIGIILNKASLTFYADTLASDYRNYELPGSLLLTYENEVGEESGIEDYEEKYRATYGGFLSAKTDEDAIDYVYSFSITRHLENIINGELEHKAFYLSASNPKSDPNRVVLKGTNSSKSIKLEVIYSKMAQ